MTIERSSTNTADFASILTDATAAFRAANPNIYPAPETVVEALLQAEKVAKQQRSSSDLTSLSGCWRLCFITGTQKARKRAGIILGKGRFIPQWVKIHLSLQPGTDVTSAANRGQIGNHVRFSQLQLALSGPLHYLNRKNLLAFDFTHLQICLLQYKLYEGAIPGGQSKEQSFYTQPISKLPFFSFFAVTEDYIAARGRGGGLALWIRVLDPGLSTLQL